MTFEQIEKRLAALAVKQAKLSAEKQKLIEARKSRCREALLTCPRCKKRVRVDSLTAVTHYHGGYRPCGEDDWHYNERTFVVCACSHVLDGDVSKLLPHVGAALVWYDHSNAPDCLAPHLARERASYEKLVRKREIESAKALLKREGVRRIE